MGNARSRYKLTKTKIKNAAAYVKAGHPKSVIYKAMGVSRRTVFNWFSEAESILDDQREPETADEKLLIEFYTAVNTAVVEGANEDLAFIEKAAEDDWRAAYARLKIRDRIYNAEIQTPEDTQPPDDEDNSKSLDEVLIGADTT